MKSIIFLDHFNYCTKSKSTTRFLFYYHILILCIYYSNTATDYHKNTVESHEIYFVVNITYSTYIDRQNQRSFLSLFII